MINIAGGRVCPMQKKIRDDDYEEVVGPMNQVSKQDAMVWAGVTDLETADEHQHRTVVAKTQKAKRSSKKHDRHMNKNVARHINIDKD